MNLKFTFLFILLFINIVFIHAQVHESSGPPDYIGKIAKVKDRLFLGSTRLYYSDNNGETWEQCKSFTTQRIAGLFSIDSTIFASCYLQGIYMSTDLGITWTKVLNFTNSSYSRKHDFFQFNDSTILFTNMDQGLYSSTNKGRSWTQNYYGTNPTIGSDGKRQYTTNYFSSGLTPGNYLIGSTDLFKTYPIIKRIPLPNSSIISAMAIVDTTIVIGISGDTSGIYRSFDLGDSWQYIKNGFDQTTALHINSIVLTNDTLYASTSFGVYFSKDHGSSWNKISAKVNYHNQNTLFFRKFDKYSYAITEDRAVLRRQATGDWEEKTAGINDGFTSDLFSCKDTLFSYTTLGSYFSTDGLNWKRYTNNLYNTFPQLGRLRSYKEAGNFLFASYDNAYGYHGTYKSPDQGKTWNKITYNFYTDFYPAQKGIYANNSFSLDFSADQGESWVQVLSDGYVYDFLEYDTLTLFCLTDKGVFRSADRGATWENVKNAYGLKKICKVGNEIAVSIANTAGVYISHDKGTSWELSSKGLTSGAKIGLIALHKGIVIASTADGIYISADTCKSWKKVFAPFLKQGAELDAEIFQNKLYLGTSEGVFYIDLDILTCIAYGSIDGCGRISGNVYFDRNENCSFDQSDIELAGKIFFVQPGQFITMTDSTGHYSLNLPYGNYEVTSYPENKFVTTICPENQFYSVKIDTAHFYIDTLHFAMRDILAPDVSVSLVCGAARPGFDLPYYIHIQNYGTVTANGVISFAPDPRVIYISADPSDSLVTNDTIYFSLKDLAPNESRRYIVNTKIPAGILRGDTLISSVKCIIPSDVDTLNNADYFERVVTGSYDPNAKHVNPLGVEDEGYIQLSDSILSYTIEFQNVGSDTAFTVVIADTLSPLLNITSIRPGVSSHPCRFEVRNGNVIRWTFSNIRLPDSATDKAGSQGYVKFYIKQSRTNNIGDIIQNKADIYFDYNTPVRTDTTTNTIRRKLSTGIITKPDTTSVLLYPNPAASVIYIKMTTADESAMYEIYDVTGVQRSSGRIQSGYFEKDISGWNSGVYFVKVKGKNFERTFILSKI